MAGSVVRRQSLSELETGSALPQKTGIRAEPWASAPTSGKVRMFLGLTLRALGVVYGDIGTSPLYVYSTLFSQREPKGEDDFIGACSVVVCDLSS